MRNRRTLFLPLLLPALPGLGLADASKTQKVATDPATPLIVTMEDCNASRPGKVTRDTGIFRVLFTGPPREALVKRGTAEVDGQKYTLYLPRAKSYSIKNSKPSDSDFYNTSTLISVDHRQLLRAAPPDPGVDNSGLLIIIDKKGGRQVTDAEDWFANLPLRLGDRMFDVKEIAADGSRIVLKPSKSPLRGVIVGHTCPPFSFQTADGKEVSSKSLAGKPFLLDIWSIT
jgi:hypothetical protein